MTQHIESLLTVAKVILLFVNVFCVFLSIFLYKRKATNEETIRRFFPKRRKVLLVIAHPDDEAMFFTPAIKCLVEAQVKLYVLCLSTGNADKLGQVRVKELKRSCETLGVIPFIASGIVQQDTERTEYYKVISSVKNIEADLPSDTHVLIIDDEQVFADGMKTNWNVNTVSQTVSTVARHYNIEAVLTFDAHGISGHPNHCAVYQGVKLFLQQNSATQGFELVTTNLVNKYIGLASVYLNRESQNISLITPEIFAAYEAMQAHASQFVWFRRLFILFSRYAYLNTFQLIK